MLDNIITSTIVSPRGKRERIANHYSKALHGLVNYFDAPESVIEFIEAALIHHGYDEDEWTATGAELAWSLASASTTDQHARIRDRIAKQRERLAKWQNTKDSNGLSRPILVAIRAKFDEQVQHWQYFYSLPIAGLVRKVVDAAPVGASQRRMKMAVAEVAKDYLLSTNLRPPSKVATRKHTPESQIRRGLAYITRALEKAKRDHRSESEIVKNALFQNDKLLETIELLKETVGIILTLSDDAFPADLPNSAYTDLLYIYAQLEQGGAAGRGVTARAGLPGLEVVR